jgi:hypothetical protein
MFSSLTIGISALDRLLKLMLPYFDLLPNAPEHFNIVFEPFPRTQKSVWLLYLHCQKGLKTPNPSRKK